MFSLSMMTVRMEIKHIFLKEEIEIGISCFPLLGRFSVFPMFCHDNESGNFYHGNVGPDHIYSSPSHTPPSKWKIGQVYFPHAFSAVKLFTWKDQCVTVVGGEISGQFVECVS